jgi:hypothetical protein
VHRMTVPTSACVGCTKNLSTFRRDPRWIRLPAV